MYAYIIYDYVFQKHFILRNHLQILAIIQKQILKIYRNRYLEYTEIYIYIYNG